MPDAAITRFSVFRIRYPKTVSFSSQPLFTRQLPAFSQQNRKHKRQPEKRQHGIQRQCRRPQTGQLGCQIGRSRQQCSRKSRRRHPVTAVVASEEDFISSARFRETSDGLTEGLDAVSRSGGSAVFPRRDVLPSAESPLRYLFSSSGFTRFHNSYAWPAPSVDL